MSDHASINVPMWNGTPKECGEVCTQGERVASCHLWTHPLGGEVKLTVDGAWVRGESRPHGAELVALALDWRNQFEGKGWGR